MEIYERWIWDSGGAVRLESKKLVKVTAENAKNVIKKLQEMVEEFYNKPYREVEMFLKQSEDEIRYIYGDIEQIEKEFGIAAQ